MPPRRPQKRPEHLTLHPSADALHSADPPFNEHRGVVITQLYSLSATRTTGHDTFSDTIKCDFRSSGWSTSEPRDRQVLEEGRGQHLERFQMHVEPKFYPTAPQPAKPGLTDAKYKHGLPKCSWTIHSLFQRKRGTPLGAAGL